MDAYGQQEIQLLWEKNRKVRVPPKESTLTVPRSVLEDIVKEDLKCPICLGTIESTLTVTACLHRFCAECLERSLRVNLGPKEHHDCPSCRMKLASRRASKKDDRFDFLVDFITIALGKRDQSTMGAVGDASPRKKNSFASSFDASEDRFDVRQYRKAHMEKVEQFRSRQKRLSAENSSKPKQSIPTSKSIPLNNTPRENKVCLALFPSEGSSIMPLSMPFLKVPPLMQVGDIKQFLNLKLGFTKAEYDLLEIYIIHQNKVRG